MTDAMKPKLLSSGNPQIPKGAATDPFRPISPRCPAGKVISGAGSTRSWNACFRR